MCGIVGAIASIKQQRNVVPVLIEGLRKLEYRGYDSAGLAIQTSDGIARLRAVGRVAELELQTPGLAAKSGKPGQSRPGFDASRLEGVARNALPSHVPFLPTKSLFSLSLSLSLSLFLFCVFHSE